MAASLALSAPPAGARPIAFHETFGSFDPQVVTMWNTYPEVDTWSVDVVPEGPSGSRCLRIRVQRADRLLELLSPSPRLRLGSPGDPVPEPDSTWVFQWSWKIGDTMESNGVQILLRGPSHLYRVKRSHQIYTDLDGSFEVRPRVWSGHRVDLRDLAELPLPEGPVMRDGSTLTPAREWGIDIEFSVPRNQTLWLDDLYLGPAESAPPLAVPEETEAVVNPAELSIGGDVLYLGRGHRFLFLPNREGHKAYAYRFDSSTGVPVDGSTRYDLSYVGGGHHSALLDADRDGDLDLVILRGAGTGLGFLENDGWNRFQAVPWPASPDSVPTVVYQVGTADFNEDGDTDLWVVRPTLPDWILMGTRGFRFETLVMIPLEGAAEPWAGAVSRTLHTNYAAIMLDADSDGHTDVFLPSRGFAHEPSVLLFGTGRGTFDRVVPISEGFPDVDAEREVGYHVNDAVAFDVEPDGDLDIALSRFNPGGVDLQNVTLLNDGDGSFTVAAATGQFRGETVRLTSGDIDNDGLMDLIEFTTGGTRVLLNRGHVGFRDVTHDSPFSTETHHRGFLADVDLDGRLDLVAFGGDPPRSHLLLRGPDNANRWIGIRPRGETSSPTAEGARITIWAEGGRGLADSLLGVVDHQQGGSRVGRDWTGTRIGVGGRSRVAVAVRFPSGSIREITLTSGRYHDVWERPPLGVVGLGFVRGFADRWRSMRLALGPLWWASGLALLAGGAGVLVTSGRLAMRIVGALAIGCVLLVLFQTPSPAPSGLASGIGVAVGLLASRHVRRSEAGDSTATTRAALELLRVFGKENSHWRRNIAKIQRRAGRLDLVSGTAREDLTELLQEARSRFLVEDHARFSDALTRARPTMSALAGGIAAIDAFAKSLGDFALLCREGSPASSEWRALVSEAGAGLVASAAPLTTRLELALSQPIQAIHDHVLARIASHSVSVGRGTPPDAAGLPVDARAIVVWSDLDAVLDHLVRNAREASGEAVIMQASWVRSATRIRLMLADDGPGIPEGIRDHVFDDAFSTRGHDRGTGLPEARRAAEAFLSVLSLVEPYAGSVGATFAIDFWTTPFPAGSERATGQEDSTH